MSFKFAFFEMSCSGRKINMYVWQDATDITSWRLFTTMDVHLKGISEASQMRKKNIRELERFWHTGFRGCHE
jgi:hypothetical protein